MEALRDIMNADPHLRIALKFRSDDPTLSGREAALRRVVACLSDDFDVLDAADQQAIVDALAVQAKRTHEAENYARRLFRYQTH